MNADKTLLSQLSTTGSLYLSSQNLTGMNFPTSISGLLYLRDCDLTNAVLPTITGDSLYLRNCNLTGVVLPTTIGGLLYVSGCDLTNVILPTTVNGKHTRCIAYERNYILLANFDGTFTAGCAKNMSKSDSLKRWDRSDNRAILFTKAIKELND